VTFGAPLFAWVAVAAAIATIGLHLLAWRRPPSSPLPTARFAPDVPIRTVSRAVRPADLALLLLRVVMILLVGAALAAPTVIARTPGLARVIVVDRSRSASGASVADAARRELRVGDALVVFDSTAREDMSPAIDSIAVTTVSDARGSLSAALSVATRAAHRLERTHDSVEIVVISPFTSDELDAATGAVRRTWNGRLRSVRTAGIPNESAPSRAPEVRAPAGDGVAAALALAAVAPSSRVRVVRDRVVAADTAWARQGNALVVWPSSDSLTGLQQRPARDTALAVMVPTWANSTRGNERSATVVARFQRTLAPPPGQVIARWYDGEPAATESALGGGCVRTVAVIVPVAGDLPLTPAFRRFVERMASPCERSGRWDPVPDSVLRVALAESIPRDSVERSSAAQAGLPESRLSAWLLAAALVAALAELVVRRGDNATA
jgi:hypothetical protein